MVRVLLAGLACLALAGCSAGPQPAPGPPRDIKASQLNGLLLSSDAAGDLLGGTLTAQPVVENMDDNRNLLPNLNCLGVWQVAQSAIYGPAGRSDGWQSMREQLMRSPDTDAWDRLIVQSVVLYPSADAAKKFVDDSAARWNQCTNHHVNVTVNGTALPKWLSGTLERSSNGLAMPITRGTGPQSRSCQHNLQAVSNVVIDLQACNVLSAAKPASAAVTAIVANVQR